MHKCVELITKQIYKTRRIKRLKSYLIDKMHLIVRIYLINVRKSASDKTGTLSDSALTRLLGPIFAPATT